MVIARIAIDAGTDPGTISTTLSSLQSGLGVYRYAGRRRIAA